MQLFPLKDVGMLEQKSTHTHSQQPSATGSGFGKPSMFLAHWLTCVHLLQPFV